MKTSTALLLAGVGYLYLRGSGMSDHSTVLDYIGRNAPQWPRAEVERAIDVISGWDSTRAGGLTRFGPKTLARLGYGTNMSETERVRSYEKEGSRQAVWIAKFLQPYQWHVVGDTFLALTAPAALGKSDSHVVFAIGTAPWSANPRWRSAGNGPVTAGSLRSMIR